MRLQPDAVTDSQVLGFNAETAAACLASEGHATVPQSCVRTFGQGRPAPSARTFTTGRLVVTPPPPQEAVQGDQPRQPPTTQSTERERTHSRLSKR